MKNHLHKIVNSLTAFSAGSSVNTMLSNQGSTLEIFIPRNWAETNKISWCSRSGDEVNQGETDDLSSLLDNHAGKKIIIWSPSADTLLIETIVPTKNKSKINQALPFILEEKLLQAPEKDHFVYQTRTGLPLAVSVTSKLKIEKWLGALHDAGLPPPVAMYPQVSGLPVVENSWSMTCIDNELIVKVDDFSGFSCAIKNNEIPVQLKNFISRLADDKKPSEITYLKINDGLDTSGWSDILGTIINTKDTKFWDLFQLNFAKLNLLQGQYKQKREINPALSRIYPAATVLGIWLVFSLFINVWEWQSLKSNLRDTKEQMTQVFKTSFPEAKTIVDPALQMQRKFETVSGGSGSYLKNDFLAILVKCVPALSALEPGAIENIRYNEKTLDINLGLPDFKTLESLKEKLATMGMQVEVVAANSRAKGIEGRLKITMN